jgi:hypothetical protein
LTTYQEVQSLSFKIIIPKTNIPIGSMSKIFFTRTDATHDAILGSPPSTNLTTSASVGLLDRLIDMLREAGVLHVDDMLEGDNEL